LLRFATTILTIRILLLLLLLPGIERVQALADISRSALCCHSNETRAPIANPPNSAQLEDTSYHSAKLHPGPYSSVGMRRGTDRQTDTQTRVTNIHFASATPHAKCNYAAIIITRTVQPVATCRPSRYVHKPAIVKLLLLIYGFKFRYFFLH